MAQKTKLEQESLQVFEEAMANVELIIATGSLDPQLKRYLVQFAYKDIDTAILYTLLITEIYRYSNNKIFIIRGVGSAPIGSVIAAKRAAKKISRAQKAR